jgi:energy-coupling factor transport system ATP-binding protein
MAPLVDITGLRYRYPQSPLLALDGVDLTLDSGLTLVAGPSGGGKSTLLRLLNGLVPHMHGGRISGAVMVDGRDVLRTPTRRLATSVGFVFQDAERQAVHTVVEADIAFGLENLAVPREEMHRRVRDVTDALGIGHLRDRTIATLSGGERQRVAIAGALVLRPRLLVLDEPLSQLDTHAARALVGLCRDLRDSGTAVVMSEHRLDELLPAADAVVAIAGGQIAGPAPPAALALSLDSAPQVVRLSATMGWSPPLLDAGALTLPPTMATTWGPSAAPAGASEAAWRLNGVAAGHAGLLTDVSATGCAGEVIAVMGGNGAGKTTLLRVIAGLLPPRAGERWLREGRVAYLPQNPAALLHRESVRAEVEWTSRRDRHPATGPATADLLDILGVSAIIDRDPRDLSSGQRQRAAIAAVLCGGPSTALLDEPTRGMDGAARDGLALAARVLAAHGACVVIATHDSDLVATVADRVLLIEHGAVIDRGAPARALSGPGAYATQLGRLFNSPRPVTVEAVAALLSQATMAGVRS